MLEVMLNEYRNKFNENFPIMLFRGTDDEEVIQIIQDCLVKGKPYEVDLNETADY